MILDLPVETVVMIALGILSAGVALTTAIGGLTVFYIKSLVTEIREFRIHISSLDSNVTSMKTRMNLCPYCPNPDTLPTYQPDNNKIWQNKGGQTSQTENPFMDTSRHNPNIPGAPP